MAQGRQTATTCFTTKSDEDFLRAVDAFFVVGCADNDVNGNAGGFTEFINVPDGITATVSEPSAALLFGLALPLLVLWRRQRSGRARGRLILRHGCAARVTRDGRYAEPTR